MASHFSFKTSETRRQATSNDNETVYTPPAIKGYRKLTQAELDSVNAVKNLGAQIEDALDGIHCVMTDEQNARCLAIARTEFQTALMWLTRSITKPETFA